MAAPCELLEWDSEHFGFPIARIRSRRLTASAAEAVDQWCVDCGIRCAYFLADPEDPETARVAAIHGYRMVDIRVSMRSSYEELLRREERSEAMAIREGTRDDLAYARRLAARSHRSSRFYFDGGFPAAACDALYAAWIDRGFRDPERRFLVGVADREVVGYFVLGPLGPDGLGNGELAAVEERHRGRGYGRALHQAAYRDFASRGGLAHLGIVSFRNIRALRLHERLGFLTDKVEVWHHKWFPR